MKRKLILLTFVLGAAMLLGCGKSKDKSELASEVEEEITTVSADIIESQKENDITTAKSIKTAVETTLGNENSYMELTGSHANQLIAVSEQGLSLLEETTKTSILSNVGNKIPEVKYKELGADHFGFIVDANGSVTVYACNANNSTKWMLTPDVDMEYGGTVNTELIGVEQPGATAETDFELESVQKSNDVTSAKSIKTAVETALGNENMYEELTNRAGEIIVVTEDGLDVLSADTKKEIITNLGKLPEVAYTANGADHFVFIVDADGCVTVSVASADHSKYWMLVPDLDAEYGGDNVETEEPTEEEINPYEGLSSAEQKANDITSAKCIKTAVETALGSEDGWDELTDSKKDTYIIVTDEGLNELSERTKNMIIENLGNKLPQVAYRDDGAQYFAFMVTEDGQIFVYAINVNNGDLWTLVPNVDAIYN